MNKKIKKSGQKKQKNLFGEIATEPTEKQTLKRIKREKKWAIEREHIRNNITPMTLMSGYK